jgi:Ca-activated chloride channel family protein
VNAALFAHPEWLALLATAVAATALGLALARVASRRRRARLGPGLALAGGSRGSDLALFAALAAVALALAGPRIGSRFEQVSASGVDVVFVLDVSRSMEAHDVPPSRLERARRAVRSLLERLEPADRAALVAFAGRGLLLTPLTPDRDALAELLAGVDTGLVSPTSSRLDEGLRAALSVFEAGSERPRVVWLLGDGEDPEHRGDPGAAELARADVRVLAAGFGTEVGSTLDDHGTPLLDASGKTVVTRRDLARLERLTQATDGQLFAADAWGEIDLAAAIAATHRDAGTSAAPGEPVLRRVRAVPVAPLGALAFGLLLGEAWLEGARFARGRRAAVALAGAACVLVAALPAPAGDDALAPLASFEREARLNRGDPHALIELGAARLERGQRDAAARAFLAAALSTSDGQAAGVAYFDLGVAALESGDYAAARTAFLDALALSPRDERARFNLEWTLQALKQQAPVASPEPPPDEPKPEHAPVPPPPQPEETSQDSQEQTPPPSLSPEEQQRWLARVHDDPGRALRAAARGEAPGGRREPGPAW